MPKKMGVWRERCTATADATTYTHYSDYVPEGEWWYLQRVSILNDTTASADCLISIDCGTHKHPLYYFANVTQNIENSQAIECWLRPGERLQFDWTGIVSTERLYVHVTGHKQRD